MTMDHDRPELRERVKAALLGQTTPSRGEMIAARALWEQGRSVGEISEMMGMSMADVVAAIQGQREQAK